MKTENKKILIILGIILGIALILFILGVNSKQKTKSAYKSFEEAFTKEEPTLIYLGRTTCGWCKLLDPSLNEMKERYHFDVVKLEADKISQDELNNVAEKFELTSIATPYLAVVNKDGILDVQSGYVDYDKLFEFLQKNNIIDENATLLLDYIDYAKYTELLSGNELSVVVIGQSTCSYCVQTKPILNEIVEEKNLKIHYLNLSYMTKEEGEQLEASLDYFQNNEWGTPLTLILKNNKLVASLEGYTTKAKFIKFFEENGVL